MGDDLARNKSNIFHIYTLIIHGGHWLYASWPCYQIVCTLTTQTGSLYRDAVTRRSASRSSVSLGDEGLTEEDVVMRTWKNEVSGHRKIGTSKLRWSDVITKDMNAKGVKREEAQDQRTLRLKSRCADPK